MPPKKPTDGSGAKPKAKKKETETKKEPSSVEHSALFKTHDEEKKFLKKFWEGRNGNDLIKKLNAFAQEMKLDDSIRREKESPVVYAVVLNDKDFPFKDEEGIQWKLCKVGFTHRSIEKGNNNRMEQVQKEIKQEYDEKNKAESSPAILFALRIGAVDTTPFYKTEKRIRKKVGISVLKAKAKELGLPCPTEWVLTTQNYIDNIMTKKKDEINGVKETGEGDVMDFFKEIKPPSSRPLNKYKGDWF